MSQKENTATVLDAALRALEASRLTLEALTERSWSEEDRATIISNLRGPGSIITRQIAPVIGRVRALLAKITPQSADDWNDPSPELEANAKLIAAAPDLLAAAQSALDWLGDCLSGTAQSEIAGELRAAIAKAGA